MQSRFDTIVATVRLAALASFAGGVLYLVTPKDNITGIALLVAAGGLGSLAAVLARHDLFLKVPEGDSFNDRLRRDWMHERAQRRVASWYRTYCERGRLTERSRELKEGNDAKKTASILEKIISIGLEQGDRLSRMRHTTSQLELGLLYLMMGDLGDAELQVREAVSGFESLAIETSNDRLVQEKLAVALFRLAEVHYIQERWAQARAAYERSAVVFESLGHRTSAETARKLKQSIVSAQTPQATTV